MNRILLIDSKKDICDFIVGFFRERNFEVFSAATGTAALQAINKIRPDIVLMELKIKDMDGIELLKSIKNMSRRAKVIVMSSVDDIEVIDEAKRLGAMAYLTKPVQLSELVDIVLKNLTRRHRFFNLMRLSRG